MTHHNEDGVKFLMDQLCDWKERALRAESQNTLLQRKLTGERKRNDPRNRVERKLKKRKYNS